jgi:ABC-type sugar transport system ATPase subunit
MENEFVLQMKDINKSFPGVRALKDVNLNVRKGTIHALMGENGAGKSTLMKILIGLYQPDKGEIIYKGKRLVMNGPPRCSKFWYFNDTSRNQSFIRYDRKC